MEKGYMRSQALGMVKSDQSNKVMRMLKHGGRWQEALHWLFQMQMADEQSFKLAIGACEKGSAWQPALALLFAMEDPPRVACGAVMSACKRGARWRHAIALLEALLGMKATPDEISYNAAIVACGKHSWEKALGVFARMRKEQIEADVISYGSVIHACGTRGQWRRALLTFEELRLAKLQVNEILYSSLMKGCDLGGEWQVALQLLGRMSLDGVRADVVVCGAALSACAAGSWTEALQLLNGMQATKMEVNLICCNAAVSACDKGGQWRMALILLESFPRRSLRADTITYSAAISACQECHRWEASLSLLEAMSHKRIRANEITYSTTISALEKAGLWTTAVEMLVRMEDLHLEPNVACYGAAMSACDAAAAGSCALGLIDDMWEGRLIPTGLIAGSAAGALRDKSKGFDLLSRLRTACWPDAPAGLGSTEDLLGQVLALAPGILAVMKPEGIRTEELIASMAKRWHGPELFLVSRLDHPTSGVLPLALGREGSAAANWLQAQFAARLVEKEYICLVEGCLQAGRVDTPLLTVRRGDKLRTIVSQMGREALTEYKVLQAYKHGELELSLLSVRPMTGRTHQIRVHLASISHPIAGDLSYGSKRDLCHRLFLHCARVKCWDLAGERLEVSAPLPDDLRQMLDDLVPL